MDGIFLFILLMFGVYMVFRFAAIASAKSAQEEIKREIVREYFRKRRIDELYGRDREDEEG